jgi:DNA-directed RNA polymerase beta' subunit
VNIFSQKLSENTQLIMKKYDEIRNVLWGLLTPDQWKAYSVVNITHPSSKDHTSGDEQKVNTPLDSRMGEQRNQMPCGTCMKTNIDCPGHMGTITLPIWVYNKDFSVIILKILQSMCPFCARPRMIPEHIKMHGLHQQDDFKRLKDIAEKCNKSVTVCPWNDCQQPLLFFSLPTKKKKSGDGVIYYTSEWKKNKGGLPLKKEEFSAEAAREIFSRISFEHLQALGFNNNLLPNKEYYDPIYLLSDKYKHVHQFHPEALLWKEYPVIPTLARPYVQNGDEIKEDDLTTKYNTLIETIRSYNKFVKDEGINMTSKNVSTRRGRVKTKVDIEKDIMKQVWSIADNKEDTKVVNVGVNREYKAIHNRLIGKRGRIQENVGGKRTNFSARSPIVGGGINLKFDELGVPREICETETKPVYVGPWNIDEVQNLVLLGKINHVTRGGNRKNLMERSDKGKNFVLKNGDVADRQLQDGDMVLFNRQPTLRIESMVAFRVKIVEGYAFQLGLAWTKAFNADFDGI